MQLHIAERNERKQYCHIKNAYKHARNQYTRSLWEIKTNRYKNQITYNTLISAGTYILKRIQVLVKNNGTVEQYC